MDARSRAQELADRVQATYGDHCERFARIRAEYDPDNFFRANQNIRPVARV